MKKDQFKALIPAIDGLSKKLKAMFADAAPAAAPADAGTTEVETIETEAKDGSKIEIEGGLVQGASVTVVSQDGSEIPAPDGDLELKDGSILSLKDGLILEVKPPQDPANTGSMQEQPFAKEVESLRAKITEMSDRLNAYEKANAVLMAKVEKAEASIGQAKDVISETFKVVEQIAGMPSEKPIESKPSHFAKKEDKLALIAKELQNLKPKTN